MGSPAPSPGWPLEAIGDDRPRGMTVLDRTPLTDLLGFARGDRGLARWVADSCTAAGLVSVVSASGAPPAGSSRRDAAGGPERGLRSVSRGRRVWPSAPPGERGEGEPMPKYVTLYNWTDQGIKNFRDTAERAKAATAQAEKMGGRLTQLLWTVGPYDVVGVAEFPDDEAASAFQLLLGSLGNVRSTTMRAFDATEMARIVGKAR